MSPREVDQKILAGLPPRVRSAYFREKTRQAHGFSVEMLRDNKKHAEAIDGLKRQRSAKMEKQAKAELAQKLVYNEKVKQSKSKIVRALHSERLLRRTQVAQRRALREIVPRKDR